MDIPVADVAVPSDGDLLFLTRREQFTLVDHFPCLINDLIEEFRGQTQVILQSVTALDIGTGDLLTDLPDLRALFIVLSDNPLNDQVFCASQQVNQTILALGAFTISGNFNKSIEGVELVRERVTEA